MACCPLRCKQSHHEQKQPPNNVVQQVKDSCSGEQRGEKQPSLGSQDRQRPVHGLVHAISSSLWHGPESRKHPSHEVDCADGHANAEDDAGDGLFGVALAVGVGQAADHDGNQTQAGRNWASK